MRTLKTRYASALHLLSTYPSTLGMTITTPAALAPFMPHLTVKEIATLIAKVKRTGAPLYLAIPAVTVAETFHVACIEPRTTGKGAKPMRLRLLIARNIKEETKDPTKYAKRAVQYAQKHWGDTLIPDTWKSYVTLILENPKDLHADGQPRTKLELTFVTARDWNVINNDRSGPHSQLINDSIVKITHLDAEASEIRGGRGGFAEFSCIRCSSGLGCGGCPNCKARFRDSESRSGWGTPLPAKVVDYITSLGYRFTIDPKLAQAVEQHGWALSKAQYERDEARKERYALEARLAEVKKLEADASGRHTTSEGLWNASKEAVNTVVTSLDAAAAATETARKATRRQKDAQRREKAKAETPKKAVRKPRASSPRSKSNKR